MKPGQVLLPMGAGVLQQKVPVWHRVLFDGIHGLCQEVPNQSLLASRKVGLLCCWSRGVQHPVLSQTTQLPCWALLHRRATVSLRGKEWRLGAMKDESLQLFPCPCWEKVQTDLSCPAPAPTKAHLISIAHPERLPQELPCITQCQAEHNAGLHEMQCWAASRSEQAPATPAQSMASRPLLSASTCPNRF